MLEGGRAQDQLHRAAGVRGVLILWTCLLVLRISSLSLSHIDIASNRSFYYSSLHHIHCVHALCPLCIALWAPFVRSSLASIKMQ